VCTDIRQFFLQIKRTEFDRQFQRFLYRSDPSKEPTLYRLTTVSFGDTSSPFTSSESLTFLCQKFGACFKLADETLRKQRYVDDICQFNNDEEKLLENYKQVATLLSIGGFQLSKSFTNSPLVYDYIMNQKKDELSEKAYRVFNYDDEITDRKLAQFRVLGLGLSECLGYIVPQFLDDLEERVQACGPKWTKRKVASLFAANFDPCGFWAPCTTTAKLILQRCWRESSVATDLKRSWDVQITDQNLLDDINRFIQDLYLLKGLRIKRVCLKANAKLRRLVVFADASQRVYSACCYLIGRTHADDEKPSCHLVFAKSRLTPSKQVLSIARAELLAACLGTEIALEV